MILRHLTEGETVICSLRYVGSNGIQYKDEYGGTFQVQFVNDATGTGWAAAIYYGGGSSSGSFLSASTISPAITDDLTENNMGITLPENIVVNWDGGDKVLPLISVDNNNIWYGVSVGNTKILKSFKNSKTDNDYGESDNWGPIGPNEISIWDKSASLKDYIDAIKTRS